MRQVISLICNKVPSILMILALTSCGGGGGGNDDSASGQGQLSASCDFRIFAGASCPARLGPVALLVLEDSRSEPAALCSGVFLSNDKVLTAGHCLPRNNSRVAKISVETSNGRIAARETYLHPGYIPQSGIDVNDIAILVLEQPVSATTLPLLVSEPLSVGQDISVFGFGKDENQQNSIDRGDSPIAPKGANIQITAISNGVIFMGAPGVGVCSGDSGGPAVRYNRDGLPGIVSIASAGLQGDCVSSVATIDELEQVLGRPISQEERNEILEVFPSGVLSLNLFTNTQDQSTVDFILGVVPEAGVI